MIHLVPSSTKRSCTNYSLSFLPVTIFSLPSQQHLVCSMKLNNLRLLSFLCLSPGLKYHMLRSCRYLRGLMHSATNSTILSHSTCTYTRGLSTQHLSHIEMTRSILVRELHRRRNGIGREYRLETFWQQKVPFEFLWRNSTKLLNNFSPKFSKNFFRIEYYLLKINTTHSHLRLRN